MLEDNLIPLGKRKPSAARPPAQRSAVTNNRRQFVVGDGRSPWARRMHDLMTQHADDAGGAETLSAAQMSLCRRAATIEVELEYMEGQLSLGSSVDLDCYGRLADHLRRILETLGVERIKRVVNDGSNLLADYFARPIPKDPA